MQLFKTQFLTLEEQIIQTKTHCIPNSTPQTSFNKDKISKLNILKHRRLFPARKPNKNNQNTEKNKHQVQKPTTESINNNTFTYFIARQSKLSDLWTK